MLGGRLGIILWLLVAAPAGATPTDAAAGAALMARGRYAEARTRLESAARTGKALEARYQLGLLYRAIGEQKLEREQWNAFYDDYEQGRIDRKSARELGYVARAAHMLGGWKDANDTFRDAVDADPKGAEGARANIGWARLFLEKYDAGHAEVCLDEALKILPEDAEGRTLLAAVKLEQSYDVAGALRELDRAEKAARGFVEARLLRARIALEGEDHAGARRIADEVLAQNPEDVGARTILAGAALLDDQREAYAAQRARVLAVHPRAARFFHELGELLVREHRYLEAVPLEEEALRVDDKDPVARAAYGANLLRLGREAEGLEALRAAWKKDKYNVRTYNLLQLFEDVIPKAYTTIEAPPFRLRVPIAERALLEATALPLLRRAEQALTALYGFAPAGPVTVELYTDPKHYAVRTIGLPGLDALGVTFGSLVTAMSPSMGKFNWGMVLWHELSHVYAIQASRSRVPRWFTEGLSEYETTVADPLWTRRTSSELASALQRKTLLPLERLDLAFLHARNLSQMVVAYHEAAAAVRYFVERAGRKGVLSALRRFSEGASFATIVKETTGEDLARFDVAFHAWLAAQLRGYEGQLLLRPTDYSDVEALEAAHQVNPKEPRTRALLALAKLQAGQIEEAQKLLEDRKTPSAEVMYAAVRVFLATKHLDEARAGLQILRATARGVEVELLAARVAKASNDVDGAWTALVAAAAADPDRAEPWALMAELASGKPTPKACGADPVVCKITALTKATELEIMDGGLGKQLFALLAAGKNERALEAGRRALDIAPFDGALRLQLATLLAERGDKAAARAELARARMCTLSDQGQAAATKLEAQLGTTPRR
jgi:tetratricopeptide (TPR) repeat protein